ncbi:MAG: DEAD/DEAH box helicase [Candidatus Micrarchaeota archaeon]|nr:DEAD/DEAH box helicase [Candidatus Micrarchaeota archaeon]
MDEVYSAFLEEFGKLTDIQELAFPVVERGENAIITASPGSGKTEAAILPILKRISENKERQGVSALYVTPLRALNRDLFKRLKKLCDRVGIRIEVRHGDTTQAQRTKQSNNPPDILITTPETVQSLLMTKNLYRALKHLDCVIVDELHELYYNKRGAQFAIALERLVEISKDFQRVGISATIGDINSAAFFLCAARPVSIVEVKRIKNFSIEIEMPKHPKEEHSAFVERFNLDRQALARIEYIASQIKKSEAALIFANTRQVVESLGNKLLYFNTISNFGGIGVHHSSLDKEERIETENSFKEGKVKSIIATSSLELGIDIGKINLVIQYGSPRQVTRLVQRMGRSGHTEGGVSNGRIIVASVIDAIESAAIVALSKEGRLEKRTIQENALDVLLNQIAAIALEYKEFDAQFAYNLVRRSSCYSKLERGRFDSLVAFAQEQGLVREQGGKLSLGRRSRRYLYEKISVIPDATKFVVKNVSSNKVISYLDENFVYNNVEEGVTFVTKGLVWRVISVEESTIFVEPSVEVDGAIPDWEGEDIPVSYHVATRAFGYFDKKKTSELKEALGTAAYNTVIEAIDEQDKSFPIEAGALYIEETDERAIMYTALGKQANELLAKIIGSLISASVGKLVRTRATPYAIIVEYEGAHRIPDLKKIFEAFGEYGVEKLVRSNEFVANFDMFRYKFIQVAKLFGVIEKKATVTRSVAMKLMSFYKGSPIFDEAVRDLVHNSFDVEGVMDLQRRLRSKETKVFVYKSYGSAIAGEMLKSAYFYRELLNPLVPSSEELEQFTEGIMRKSAELICTFCGFRFKKKLSDIKEGEKILCILCKSPMVAVYSKEYEEVILKRVKEERLKKSERETLANALVSASLVEAYGLRALMALATYGVGLKTAARVLRMLRKEPKLLLIDLISAQKQFVKNKKYWAGR